jgi:hypothetical protein
MTTDQNADERRCENTKVLRQCVAHLSSAAEIQKNHEEYMTSLLPTDDLAIYRKADLVANCYNRNLPIRANINRITEPGTSEMWLNRF